MKTLRGCESLQMNVVSGAVFYFIYFFFFCTQETSAFDKSASFGIFQGITFLVFLWFVILLCSYALFRKVAYLFDRMMFESGIFEWSWILEWSNSACTSTF